jgi:serine/threonine-protein kinase
VVGGSSLYMSPEQASPEALAIDIRADLYSLGAVLFEMVTGRPPFLCAADEKSFEDHGRVSLSAQEALLQSSYSLELRGKQRFIPPPSPRRFNPDLPEAVEEVILTCLQKQPERRFESALDLLTALTSFRIEADGTVVSTRAPGARAAPARTAYRLQAVAGPVKGMERILDSVAIKAGRKVATQSGFPLPPNDKTASGEHALFENAGDYVIVVDLESSNGTFVNGRKIAKAKLKDGDKVTLGQTVIRVSVQK